jgi:regulatory protein
VRNPGPRRTSPPKPKPVTAARLEKAALHYLGRYASSAQNLRRVLIRRLKRARLAPDDPAYGAALGWIEDLLARFQASGLVDDRTYAEAQAASFHRRGLSRAAIGRRLGVKGVGRDQVAAALATLEETSGDTDLRAALTLARRRRLGPFRAKSERRARRTRDLAALGRAGFGYQIARKVIDAEDADELEAEAKGTAR